MGDTATKQRSVIVDAVSEARKYSWGAKLAFGCFVVYQVYLKGSDVAF